MSHRLAGFAAVLVLAGCAPTLKVNVLQPAPINFGASKRLSVVQSEGRRSAREHLIAELTNQARTGGHFTVTDRSEEGITVKIAGRTVQVAGGNAPQAADEIYMRIDVIDWNANRESQTVTNRDSKGHAYTTTVTQITGKVVLGVTAANAQGMALMAEREYVGNYSATDVDDNLAIQTAARTVVAQILGDITPRYVRKTIRLDDDDSSQKPIIKTAEAGNVPRAIDEMREFLNGSPTNAIAQYNLAVMLDATGQFQEALDFYNQAIQGNPGKEYYLEAKAECAKRLADAQALMQ